MSLTDTRLHQGAKQALCHWLPEIRNRYGMSRDYAAKILGVDVSTWHLWESAQRLPHVLYLLRLEVLFGRMPTKLRLLVDNDYRDCHQIWLKWFFSCRMQRRLTLTQIAQTVDVAVSVVNQWDRGRTWPTMAQAARLETLYGPMPPQVREWLVPDAQSFVTPFSEWFRWQRLYLGLTPAYVARLIEEDLAVVLLLEKSERLPTEHNLETLANIFGPIPSKMKYRLESILRLPASPFSRWLRDCRLQAERSIYEIALQLEISPLRLANLENGIILPTEEMIKAVESVYGPMPRALSRDRQRSELSLGSFAEWLRTYRTQKRLSQAQLAQKSGVGADAIRRFEHKKSEPTPEDVERLESALAVVYDKKAFALDLFDAPNAMAYWVFSYRRRHRLTHEAFARKFGFAASYVSEIEDGSRIPGYDWVNPFEERLGVMPLDVRKVFMEGNSVPWSGVAKWAYEGANQKQWPESKLLRYIGLERWQWLNGLSSDFRGQVSVLFKLEELFGDMPESLAESVNQNIKPNTFSVWLKEKRRELGKTRVAIAKASGLTARNIFNWESGRTLPSLSKLAALGKAVGEIPLEIERAVTTELNPEAVNPFAEWLRTVVSDPKMSFLRLASKIEEDANVVFRWTNGTELPTVEQLVHIERFLKVPQSAKRYIVSNDVLNSTPFGRWLQEVCYGEKKCSREDLRRIMGINQLTLQSWECGLGAPLGDMILYLEKHFGQFPDDVIEYFDFKRMMRPQISILKRPVEEWLERERLLAHLTFAQAAEKFGVEESVYEAWESQNVIPPTQYVSKIEEVFGPMPNYVRRQFPGGNATVGIYKNGLRCPDIFGKTLFAQWLKRKRIENDLDVDQAAMKCYIGSWSYRSLEDGTTPDKEEIKSIERVFGSLPDDVRASLKLDREPPPKTGWFKRLFGVG